jgi:hypothetical protein
MHSIIVHELARQKAIESGFELLARGDAARRGPRALRRRLGRLLVGAGRRLGGDEYIATAAPTPAPGF